MREISRENEFVMRKHAAIWYLVVLIAAGSLYAFTCAPGVLWQDSGLAVYRIWHNDLEGNLGLAVAHPLYIMVGIAVKHVPLGELAWRVNLVSAVFGAVAIANLFLLLFLWIGRVLPAVIGAVTLGIGWTFWWHAVVAEVYTLYAAQLFGELIMLFMYVRTKRYRYLYLLGLLNGLTIANHMWGIFGFVSYAVFLVVLLVRKQVDFKHLGIIVMLWIIGALPYEYIIIKNMFSSGEIVGTLASAAFGDLWRGNVLNTSVSLKIVLENIVFILLNFPTPNFLLFFFGLWMLWRVSPSRSFANIVFAMLVMHFVFAFRYTVVDRHAFFLPFYCLAAVLTGLGADFVLNRFNRRTVVCMILVFLFLPIPIYFITPAIARQFYKPLGQKRQRVYRDEYEYFLMPWKSGCRGAERFADEALAQVEKNAIIYAYTTDVHVLLYAQEVKGKRKDVRIVSHHDGSKGAPAFAEETIGRLMEGSAVYVVSVDKRICPDFLLDKYDFIRAGVLYRVVEKNFETDEDDRQWVPG